MKVLVTGGTGFVGSHAVEALGHAGHQVRLLARSPEKVERVARLRGLHLDDVHYGDMEDEATVKRAIEGCDAVLHAAASVEIGRARDVFASNLEGSRNVIGAALDRGLDPVLYVSSIMTMFPPRGPVITVDDPITSLSTDYGRSKSETERWVRGLQAEGLPVVSVYPTGVYGPEDPGFGAPLKGLRDRLRFGFPMASGGFGCVDVRDLALLLVAALEPGRGPRRFMAGGHFVTWPEEADLVEDIVGRKVRRLPAPGFALRATGRLVDLLQRLVPSFDYPLTHEAALIITDFVPCDSSRTTEELGIVFRPMRETLTDSLRWLLHTGELAPELAPRLADPRPVNGSS
ncbi:MAG: NAD-dependent epimerase/dehydratase family protein [Myxococcota bacterium]|nr:NAD-dependent epimerase/dehydratase family protein [Myxococcota bacterium]